MSNDSPSTTPPTVHWTSLSGRLSVQFLQRVLMQIRMDVQHAAGPREGNAAGYAAVLLGTSAPDEYRIEAWRPLPFAVDQLSVLGPAASPSLPAPLLQDDVATGAKVIGWLILHARTELDLDNAEMRLHNRLFPQGEALLVVMSRQGEQAELRFHRCGEAVEAFDPPLRIDARGAALPEARPKPSTQEEPVSDTAVVDAGPVAVGGALPGLLVLFAAVFALTVWFCWPALESEFASPSALSLRRIAASSSPADHLQLTLTDDPSGQKVHWNSGSLPIRRAAQEPDGFQAELIEDEQAVANASELTLAQLQGGEFVLAPAERHSVTMRLRLKSSHEQWSESMTWTAPLPAQPAVGRSAKEDKATAPETEAESEDSPGAKKLRPSRTK